MTAHELTASIQAVQRAFSTDRREGQVCTFVFERLSQLKDQFDSVTLGSVAASLGWSDAEGQKAIVRALDYLTFGEVQVLERRFELWANEATGEVLEQPVCELTDHQVRQALEQHVLVHPMTGEEMVDFADHITVTYVVTPFAHSLVRPEANR